MESTGLVVSGSRGGQLAVVGSWISSLHRCDNVRDASQRVLTRGGAVLCTRVAPVCESAPWLGRDGHTAVVFQDYIYVFGGTCDAYSCFNDVWRTKNGSTWEQITCDAAWPEVGDRGRAGSEGRLI